jgi:outer membrane protein OmpA-like peptidoglycan-associated protein
MVRKQGFYNKRLEARVNVEGCYLCMEGFGTVNPGVVDNLTSAKNNALGTLLANVELERINTKKNIKINNIYYAYNSADLTEESKKELDKLTSILQNNPSLIVELGSHTDSRGSEESNLKLSQARAQSAVDYILNSGLIDRNRLKARGYGESQLTNKCADGTPCSESEHLQNRRTELKILGFGDDPYAGLSLAQIISREQSLKMLKAGEFDKEFKVSDNGQMVATPQPQPVKPEPKPQPKPVNPPKTSVKTEPIAMKTDNFDENAPINKPSQQVNSEKTQPTKVATPSVEKPKQGENIIKTDDFDEKLPPKSAERRPNIDLDKAVGGTLKVNLQPVGNFSGYKIEIFKSLTALPADDPDMKMIALEIASDIYFEKTNNGIAYLVGNIQSYSEAEHFLNKILEKYPKARMVEFFNGKRIGE